MKTLPNKMSELLLLAVNDCEAIEKKSNYKFDMTSYFNTVQDVCTVCMAGAILVNTCEIDLPKIDCKWRELDHIIYDNKLELEIYKFVAIDEIRQGHVETAYYSFHNYDAVPQLSAEQILAVDSAKITIKNSYNFKNGRAAWEDYKEAASILQEVGL